MEIEYSLFIFTNIILFLNLLNSCFVARRFNRLEIRIKALEDSNESHQSSQPVQQAVISSYPPITTPVYPQMSYTQYQQPFNSYQAPSAPLASAPLASAPPYYPHQGPSL